MDSRPQKNWAAVRVKIKWSYLAKFTAAEEKMMETLAKTFQECVEQAMAHLLCESRWLHKHKASIYNNGQQQIQSLETKAVQFSAKVI